MQLDERDVKAVAESRFMRSHRRVYLLVVALVGISWITLYWLGKAFLGEWLDWAVAGFIVAVFALFFAFIRTLEKYKKETIKEWKRQNNYQ